MIIGIISDIHSNVWALKKALRHPHVEKWLCLGDFVGLLPMANETTALLKNHDVITISGDHESCFLKNSSLKNSTSGDRVLKLQRKSMAEKNMTWIASLPEKRSVKLGRRNIFLTHSLTHGGPDRKYRLNLPALEEQYKSFDVVIAGHTHLPFLWEGKHTLFLNPGSLGFPVAKIKCGNYLILDTRTLGVQFCSVKQNTHTILRELTKRSYPTRISDIVTTWI